VFVILIASCIPLHAFCAVPTTPAGDGGHVTVPTFVNGKGPYPFILDTGADGTSVYQWLADRLHLASGGAPESINGMTGSVQVPRFRVDRLRMDGREIHDLIVDALPNRKDQGRQAGVLGTDFMAGMTAIFDFACRRIELHRSTNGMGNIVGHSVAIHAEHAGDTDLLQIPVTINGATGVAVLDTGSRVSKLNLQFARAAGVDPRSATFHDEAPIQGANLKPMIPRSGLIGQFEFGGVHLDEVSAQVVDLPVMQQVDPSKSVLWLGADLLQIVRFVYNHDAQTVWFRRSACAPK
jgi:predicted aspartyl protease